jgi:hypothetical protein
MRRLLHRTARDEALLEGALVAIHVGQERLQRTHALRDPALEHRPLGGGQDPGQRVEREDAVGGGRKRDPAGAEPLLDLAGEGGGVTQAVQQLGVMRPRAAVGGVGLVVGAFGRRAKLQNPGATRPSAPA